VVNTDLNLLSVLKYAVNYLKVKHIIVCGHYGCGGVKAAMSNDEFGLLNKWLRNIKDVYRFHNEELDAIDDEEECERSYFIDEEHCRTSLLRVRIDWSNHVRKCKLEKSFNHKYWMTYESFCWLVSKLQPHIKNNTSRVNHEMYIAPEMVMAVGIQYLAGEPYTALNDICNIATSSVYKLQNRFIDAMLASDDFKIKFPESGEEWEKVRHHGFENISSYKLFCRCVGAIDGFFAPII
jgi:hypothetical protein